MRALKFVAFSLTITAVAAMSLSAEEKTKKQGKKQRGPAATVAKKVDSLELSDEQKQKVAAVVEEYKKKSADLQAKHPEAKLTREQRQAQKEASTEAKDDGKSKKEARAAAKSAVKLSDEQKKAQAELAEGQKSLQADLKKSLAAHLNEEQIAKLGLGERKKKSKGTQD